MTSGPAAGRWRTSSLHELAPTAPPRPPAHAARATHEGRAACRRLRGHSGRRRGWLAAAMSAVATADGGVLPAAQARAPLPRGPPQRVAQLGVLEPAAERGAEGLRVAGRDEEPAVAERLGHPADVGGEHRHAAGQGLGDDHAVGLAVRGEHEQVRGGVRAVERGAGARAREVHAVAQPAGQRAALDVVGERGGAVEAAHARAAPGQVRHRREAAEQHVVALAARHRRDAQQRAAVGAPRRERRQRRRRARRRAPSASPYRSSTRRRAHSLVVMTAEAAASTSRSRSSSSGMCTSTTCRSRSRLGHEHLRRRRGDQPVEQHDRAVRDPPRAAAAGGRGATCLRTDQPNAASSSQTRRS